MIKNSSSISSLAKNGYMIVNQYLSIKECDKLKIKLKKLKNKLNNNKYFINNSSIGQLTIRDLVLRDTKTFINLIDDKLVINILKKIFKEEFILENCMASLSTKSKKNFARPIHIDGHLPTKDFDNTSDVIAVFCLDDFTHNNGATRIWPKSHESGVKIQKFKKKINKKYKILTAKKGSIIFFVGQLWHQIGENFSGEDRWSIFCHYKRWWIKPSTDFTKCGEKIFKQLNLNQKKLFGFNCIVPKFNFKTKSRNMKTLRDISKNKFSYKQIVKY